MKVIFDDEGLQDVLMFTDLACGDRSKVCDLVGRQRYRMRPSRQKVGNLITKNESSWAIPLKTDAISDMKVRMSW